MRVAVVHVATARGPLRDAVCEVNAEAAQDVAAALRRAGHEATLVPVADAACLERGLPTGRYDAAFNLCESLGGSSARELEAAERIARRAPRVTGCPPAVLALLLDKPATKRRLEALGVPTPQGVAFEAAEAADPDRVRGQLAALEPPLIVKPAREDASIGIGEASVAADAAQAAGRAAELSRVLDGPVLVERFLPGRELNVLLAGGSAPEIVLVGEIVFERAPGAPRVLGYEAKWDTESAAWRATVPRHPAPLSAELRRRLESIAQRSWSGLSLRGYARLDVRLDESGEPFVLEVNPNPDLSPGSGARRALEAARFPFERFVARQLEWGWSAEPAERESARA